MRKNNAGFMFAALLLALCLMIVAGGCGGSSSHHSSSNEDKFVNAVGDIADDLEAIANSALSNKKVARAIDDIVSQYVAVNSADSTLLDKAFYKSLIAGFVKSEDISSRSTFKQGIYCEVWSNKHVDVVNGKATVTENNTTDFQLTITSSDNHVTELTVTPNGTTSYWQAFPTASTLLNTLFAGTANSNAALLFVKTYGSASVRVRYKSASASEFTTLLNGTVSLSYTGKSNGNEIYQETPHTTTLNATIYPQDNKAYTVGIDLTRKVASAGTNALSNTSEFKMYRKSLTGSTKTLLEYNIGVNVAATPNASQQRDILTALSINEASVNIADRIMIASTYPLDVVKLLGYYVTGTNATASEIASRADSINGILAGADLSLYLNKKTKKAGDIRALAGQLGGYNHVRFGIRFNKSDEVELVRDIVNPEDLQKLRNLVSLVGTQVQTLAGLLENSGMFTDITGNSIVELIFKDLFGN